MPIVAPAATGAPRRGQTGYRSPSMNNENDDDEPAAVRAERVSKRDLLATSGPFLLLAIALIAIAYWVLDPSPPRRVKPGSSSRGTREWPLPSTRTIST